MIKKQKNPEKSSKSLPSKIAVNFNAKYKIVLIVPALLSFRGFEIYTCPIAAMDCGIWVHKHVVKAAEKWCDGFDIHLNNYQVKKHSIFHE